MLTSDGNHLQVPGLEGALEAGSLDAVVRLLVGARLGVDVDIVGLLLPVEVGHGGRKAAGRKRWVQNSVEGRAKVL